MKNCRQGCLKKEHPPSNVSYGEKCRIKKLMTFRIVKEKLLYLIGIPRKFANQEVIRSDPYCGQFGYSEQVVINFNPKDVYEGRVAVYVHYDNPIQVAVALKCLNGLKIGEGCTLKASFGTSKYCSNFLANSHCDSHLEGKCPFIHYLERRRDKVI